MAGAAACPVAALLGSMGERADPEDMDSYFMARLDPLVLVKVAEGAHRHSTADVLPDVRVPALVVAGGRDPWTPPALARQMAEAMPDAELHVLGEANHSLPIEEPDALEALVLGWLAERFPPQGGRGRPHSRAPLDRLGGCATRPGPSPRPAPGWACWPALVVAGVAVLAFVLASAAGLVGGTTIRPWTTRGRPRPPPRAHRRGRARGLPAGTGRRCGQDGAAGGGGRPGRPGQGADGAPAGAGGTGMVFLYPSDVAEAYWMKNTLVPLSIAFVAADGRVVSVAEMTPCKADPCPSYRPAGPLPLRGRAGRRVLRRGRDRAGSQGGPRRPGSTPRTGVTTQVSDKIKPLDPLA